MMKENCYGMMQSFHEREEEEEEEGSQKTQAD